MVGPEAFMEVRYLAHEKQQQALKIIPKIAKEFKGVFGRNSGGLIHSYKLDGAKTIVVTLGSVAGTVKDTVDRMRKKGKKIGVLSICSFRPFPKFEIRKALKNCKRVIVLEKSLAVGFGGVVANNVMMSMQGTGVHVYTVVAGLGGRPITQPSLEKMLQVAEKDKLDDLTFLDLERKVVERELKRERVSQKSGPIAENILRDIAGLKEIKR
jgi:pyruvate ferredoxin oxidoreductase alpha subunit